MRSELDLVQEFCELNQGKIESWGSLPVASEQRWKELKGFYDSLLLSRATSKVPSGDRYDRKEIRTRLANRSRLRIPTTMNVFFCHGNTYAPARSVNVSRGGLYVNSDITLDPGDPATLYMPNLGGGYEHLFETPVDVVWTAARKVEQRGMGLRFHELVEDTDRQLDEFIVGYLRDRLSKGNTIAHRPGWVRERWAAV
jgi:hypothetical protein